MTGMPGVISLEDFDEPINFLLYGEPGCGKTVFSLTAPNALVLACEPGTVSALRFGRTADLKPCDDWDDFIAAYQWLKRNPDHGYDWIIVDTLNAMQDMAMRAIIDAGYRANPAKHEEDVATQGDYQRWYNQFKRIVKAICNMPVNVIFNCHTMMDTDDEGEELIKPLILGHQGEINNYVVGMMQMVGYMETNRKGTGDSAPVERRILLERYGSYIAKDRYHIGQRYYQVALGAQETGNMADLEKKIKAAIAEGKAKAKGTSGAPAKKVATKTVAKRSTPIKKVGA